MEVRSFFIVSDGIVPDCLGRNILDRNTFCSRRCKFAIMKDNEEASADILYPIYVHAACAA